MMRLIALLVLLAFPALADSPVGGVQLSIVNGALQITGGGVSASSLASNGVSVTTGGGAALSYLMAQGSTQTVPDSVETKISFTTVVVSSTAAFGNTFNTSTSVWTPTTSGAYLVYSEIVMASTVTSLLNLTPIMNLVQSGANVAQCRFGSLTGIGQYITVHCSALVIMNGSSDTMQVNLTGASVGGFTLGGSNIFNKFVAIRLGP